MKREEIGVRSERGLAAGRVLSESGFGGLSGLFRRAFLSESGFGGFRGFSGFFRRARFVRIGIYGIKGFSGFFRRAPLRGRALVGVRIGEDFRVMAKISIWAKRNPENPTNHINPDSDKDAQTPPSASFPHPPRSFPRKNVTLAQAGAGIQNLRIPS